MTGYRPGRFIVVTAAALLLCGIGRENYPALAASDAPPSLPAAHEASHGDVETIVILRHGEKPNSGNGQLTPQGLNRAIALSTVLPQRFGKPDAIFAPDPHEKVQDRAGMYYYYVRPLATIEPTAIRFEMPVQTPYGASEITFLAKELTKQTYSGKTVFVAWEHGAAQKLAAELLKIFDADPSVVPQWPGSDFDSLYIIRITRAPGPAVTALFSHEQEGLNGQSKSMPVCAAK